MLEIYLDEKFHLSSEIQVVEVEKVAHLGNMGEIIVFPRLISLGFLLEIQENQRVFNFHHLYLRAQIDFLTKLKF